MKTFWFTFLLFYASLGFSQNYCVEGAWYLNELEINGQVYTYNNDAIYNDIPSISISDIWDFDYLTDNDGDYIWDFEICMFGCYTYTSEFIGHSSSFIQVSNHVLNTIPPGSWYQCDAQNQIVSDLFIDNFLRDTNTQVWFADFQFYTFNGSGVNSGPNVTLTNPNGVSATFNQFIVIDVEEFISNKFSIYPNPSQDVIYIKSNSVDFEYLEIFDLQGKQMLRTEFSNQNSIDVSQFEKGIYILQITNAQGDKSSQKFIKN